tara:strand:- start:822 stop:1061 length:240 start_codon:yes stop_codon:yes gene_type:complete
MSNSSGETGMDNFTIAELGVFLGVLGGVLTSLILTFQKSKCETINCCGIKCKRKVDNPPQDGGPPEQNPNPALPALPRA